MCDDDGLCKYLTGPPRNPATLSDDVQVRGRVARKSEPGSYTMLLSWDDVADVIHENLLTPTDAGTQTDP